MTDANVFTAQDLLIANKHFADNPTKKAAGRFLEMLGAYHHEGIIADDQFAMLAKSVAYRLIGVALAERDPKASPVLDNGFDPDEHTTGELVDAFNVLKHALDMREAAERWVIMREEEGVQLYWAGPILDFAPMSKHTRIFTAGEMRSHTPLGDGGEWVTIDPEPGSEDDGFNPDPITSEGDRIDVAFPQVAKPVLSHHVQNMMNLYDQGFAETKELAGAILALMGYDPQLKAEREMPPAHKG